jgi:hypothetical protein
MALQIENEYNIEDEQRIVKGFNTAKSLMKECVFGGSTAIYYLCIQLGINIDNDLLHDDSDIDMYYLGNVQRVTASKFGEWTRKESCPSTHVTYCNKPNMDINIHMLKKNTLSYICVGGYNIMTPELMLDYYQDDIITEKIEYKIYLLTHIQEILDEVDLPVQKFTKH